MTDETTSSSTDAVGSDRPTEQQAVRPPLRRSVTDRKLAGVCGGLGQHLDMDPVIFRVLFAVFAFFGGATVLLYGLAWLLVPAENEEQSEGQRLMAGKGGTHGLVAAAAVVLGFAVFVGFLTRGWDGTFVLLVLAAIAFAIVWSQNRGRGSGTRWQPPANWTPPGRWTPPWWQQQPSQPWQAGQPGQPGQPAQPGAAAYTAADAPTAPTAPMAPTQADTGVAGDGTTDGPGTLGEPDPGVPGDTATYPAPPPGGYGPYAYPYPPPPPPAPRRPRSALPWIVVSIALIVAGSLVAMGMSGVENVTAQLVLAIVLIVLGAGLIVGTWFGRARSLIALGSAVAVALVTVSTYSIPLRGGFGDRSWNPVSPAAVQSPYRLAGGDATMDLTQLDPRGGTVKIEASVVFGQLTVTAPDNVRLVVHAHAGMGNVKLPNGQSDGVPADRDYTVDAATETAKGTLELVLKVGAGEVEVQRVAA